MSGLPKLMERIKGFELERALRLQPPYPPVALQIDREEISLVRLKSQRGGRPLLEAHKMRTLSPASVPASIFEASFTPTDDMPRILGEMFEATGTRPGRVSLVLPDNLAKITLLTLPERPASTKQLDELVRARMRRAVPFRLEESRLAFQLLPQVGKEVSVLVVLVRRSLVEEYEKLLAGVGARVGLVDLSTPNLINLCREQFAAIPGDVALLNCARHYFSLAIVRDQQLIFFRCKNYASHENGAPTLNGFLGREVSNSLAYYAEKLGGTGVRGVFVRNVGSPFDEIRQRLGALGLDRVESIDPTTSLALSGATVVDADVAQQMAPAIGAAVGRGR